MWMTYSTCSMYIAVFLVWPAYRMVAGRTEQTLPQAALLTRTLPATPPARCYYHTTMPAWKPCDREAAAGRRGGEPRGDGAKHSIDHYDNPAAIGGLGRAMPSCPAYHAHYAPTPPALLPHARCLLRATPPAFTIATRCPAPPRPAHTPPLYPHTACAPLPACLLPRALPAPFINQQCPNNSPYRCS